MQQCQMPSLPSIFCQFYKLIMLRIYLLSFLLHFTNSRVNKHLKITCGLEEVSRDSVAMRFYIQFQNKGKECLVECIPDRCCLELGDEEDCDVLKMYGGCLETVPPGENRTVRLAAPILEPFDRRGYCVVHLHSKLKGYRIYRDTVTIPFDTGKPTDVTPCAGVDEDPLNGCRPVNCDTYYNGKKPHFSKRLKRCVDTPPCSDDDIYDESSNKCVQSVTEEDISAIKSKSNRKMRNSDVALKINTSNSTAKDAEKVAIAQKFIGNYIKKMPISLIESWRSPKVLCCIICAQCCIVISLAYYIRNRCKCVHNPKEVLNTFFSLKQEDSMTTPLLSGSHRTETTCQFQSDSSSNVDRKIQFYKACQKDRTKTSMSDDILSRCLKRRDWVTKPKSSEVIPESKENDNGVQVYETEAVSDRSGRSSKKNREFVLVDSLPIQTSSEKQLSCVEYDNDDIDNLYSNLTKPYSMTENCAQACFSKDSIDEFLTERGMLSVSGSSKTSKENVMKVLSMISHKLGPSSDPGGRNEDLELLHMSRVSFSSSNEDNELRRTVESRSSL